MKQEGRMGTYSKFHEKPSVLFSTDVASRGLDFNKAVDWVVQVDCPEDVASYIHRVGRTARYHSEGRSVLFLMPSELKMLQKLGAAKIPIQCIKANNKRLQPVSSLLSALLVQYPATLPGLAKRAFITYMKSIQKHKDREIFDVMKLPVDEFSASMGLPMTPRICFSNQKMKSKTVQESSDVENRLELPIEELDIGDLNEGKVDNDVLLTNEREEEGTKIGDGRLATRVAATICPSDPILLNELQDKKNKYYEKVREQLKIADLEDKVLDCQRLIEKRRKEKMQWREENEEEEEQDNRSDSEEELKEYRPCKRLKREENKEKEGVNCC